MTIRRLALTVVGSFLALIVLGAVALLVELSYRPDYDQSGADFDRYRAVFDRLRVELDQRGTTNEDFVDLSQLNNGEWTTACLFGGYTRPLEEMQARGTNISEKDRVRLTEAGSRGLRLAPVEEFEMAIAYVDLNNNAQFIHFKTGIGPEGQHLERCISRPATQLFLARPEPAAIPSTDYATAILWSPITSRRCAMRSAKPSSWVTNSTP